MADAFFDVAPAPIPETPAPSPTTAPGVPIGSGLTDAAGEPFGKVEDVAAEMASKLLAQYKHKPRFVASLAAFGGVLQGVESGLWDLFTKRGLDEAEGAQLDGLGSIVGEPRRGRADDVYRRFIGVRILVNRSNGRIEELNTIVRAMLGEDASFFFRQYRLALVLHLGTDPAPLTYTEILQYLRAAKAATVRLAINANTDAANALTFASVNDSDFTDQPKGLSSVNDLSTGGLLSTYRIAT